MPGHDTAPEDLTAPDGDHRPSPAEAAQDDAAAWRKAARDAAYREYHRHEFGVLSG